MPELTLHRYADEVLTWAGAGGARRCGVADGKQPPVVIDSPAFEEGDGRLLDAAGSVISPQ